MNEKFVDLNATITEIREDCEHQVKAANDRCIAAEIEAQLCKDLLAKANEARDLYMRVAERLVTQFATVEKVFADAKAMALAIPEEKPKRTEPPVNQMQAEAEA